MAIIKRYGLYTAIALFFLYLLYTLSFPYDTSPGGPRRPEHGNGRKKPPPDYQNYDWTKVPMKHPVESMTPLPAGAPKPLPKIQHKFEVEDKAAKNIREKRREEVKKAFEKCWRSYRSIAWMHDELKPITGGSRDPFGGW